MATLVRKAGHSHSPADYVEFRQPWGRAKPEKLLESADNAPGDMYDRVEPMLPLGLPFVRTEVSDGWFDWPTLPDLFPVSFPGVKTSRDSFLVDIDLDHLKTRVSDYFNPNLDHDEIGRRYPAVMKTTARFDAREVRDTLLSRGGPEESGFVRYTYRPFDNRWLYWERDTKLLDEKRSHYRPNVFKGNLWFSGAEHIRKDPTESQACFTPHIGSLHLIERGASMCPVYLRDDSIYNTAGGRRSNLTGLAQRYLDRLEADVEDLFYYALATLHDQPYRKSNAGGLRMSWPRIPLPGWPEPDKDEASTEALARSLGSVADKGRAIARLLDPEAPVPGITQGSLRSEIKVIAVPATIDGKNMVANNFGLTAGWGHRGTGGAVMPGQGRAIERSYTNYERSAMIGSLQALGDPTFDIYLNDRAFWCNVPAGIWQYKLGGYQVLKKWLSYRERGILERPLSTDEVQYFAETARRICAILLEPVAIAR